MELTFIIQTSLGFKGNFFLLPLKYSLLPIVVFFIFQYGQKSLKLDVNHKKFNFFQFFFISILLGLNIYFQIKLPEIPQIKHEFKKSKFSHLKIHKEFGEENFLNNLKNRLQVAVIKYSEKHPFAKNNINITGSYNFAHEAEFILEIKKNLLEPDKLNHSCKAHNEKNNLINNCIVDLYKEIFEEYKLTIESRILLVSAFSKAIMDQKEYLHRNFPQPKELIILNSINQLSELGNLLINDTINFVLNYTNEQDKFTETDQLIQMEIKYQLHKKDIDEWIKALHTVHNKYLDKLKKYDEDYKTKKNLEAFISDFEVVKNKFLLQNSELETNENKLKTIIEELSKQQENKLKINQLKDKNLMAKFYGFLFSSILKITAP